MPDVAVAVGSNLDPDRNLPEAMQRLGELGELVASSPIYRGRALGPDGQPDGNPDFHNSVVLIRTVLGPLTLRDRLRTIEADLGRRRSSDKFAPRPIDLDIVFYGAVMILTESIAIPDPHALDLAHIAVPLADVAPEWRPPGGTMSAADAAAAAGHTLEIVG